MLVPFSNKQKKALTWWMDGSPMATKDVVIAEGAIRSGKTLSMIDSFISWSQYNFENQNFIIAGVSVGATKRNVLEPLFSLLETKDIPYKYKMQEKKLIIGTNTYYIFGANNEASQNLVQGLTAAGTFLDEVPLIPRSFVEQAMGRCSVEGAKYWFTLNPSTPFHWFKTEVIDKAEQVNGFVIHFEMDDNPQLSEEVKERYRRMFTGVFYQRYILGKWVVAEGAIYDMFDADKHVVDAPQNPDFYEETWVGVDYATSSVMTFGLYGIKDNIIYLIKEYYWDAKHHGKQKTDREYGEDLKEFLNGWKPRSIYIDPSAASFHNQLYYMGLTRIKKAKNEVVNGIRTVASKLQEGKYLIDNTCTYTLKEFQNYSWDAKSQARGEDRPVKKDDHAMDRDRYAIHSHMNKAGKTVMNKPRGF